MNNFHFNGALSRRGKETRLSGEILEVIERGTNQFVGTYFEESDGTGKLEVKHTLTWLDVDMPLLETQENLVTGSTLKYETTYDVHKRKTRFRSIRDNVVINEDRNFQHDARFNVIYFESFSNNDPIGNTNLELQCF